MKEWAHHNMFAGQIVKWNQGFQCMQVRHATGDVHSKLQGLCKVHYYIWRQSMRTCIIGMRHERNTSHWFSTALHYIYDQVTLVFFLVLIPILCFNYVVISLNGITYNQIYIPQCFKQSHNASLIWVIHLWNYSHMNALLHAFSLSLSRFFFDT